MEKAGYKAGFVLLGVSVLMIGITLNYFSTEITNIFLAIDTTPICKSINPHTIFQTEHVKTFIKIVSVCADMGGILAIVYGFTSKRK